MGVKTRNLGNSEGKDIQWQVPLNADGSTIYNLDAGKGYFINTTGGEVELKLPTGSLGDRIAIMDFGGTFNTNPIRLNLNGQKLNGSTNPSGSAGSQNYVKIDTQNARLELVFSDSDKGWVVTEAEAKTSPTTAPFAQYTAATGGTITTSGNFKIHTFTGDGCFVVSTLGNEAGGGDKVSYLVVAGGGSGGFNPGNSSGGGGAGGFREGREPGDSYTVSPLNAPGGLTITATTFPVTVGAGGSPVSSGTPGVSGNDGSNSVFSTITSAGGGKGGTGSGSGSSGGNGGSGGGAGGGARDTAGGIGNTPPVSPPQGNNGGNGVTNSPARGQGGGGGAGQAGSNSPGARAGGPGGNGTPSNITGSDVTRAGGGGGGGGNGTPRPPNATGGTGGAGNGGQSAPSGGAGGNATANTGSGGGGGGDGSPAGGNGGKGVVVIRYKFQ